MPYIGRTYRKRPLCRELLRFLGLGVLKEKGLFMKHTVAIVFCILIISSGCDTPLAGNVEGTPGFRHNTSLRPQETSMHIAPTAEKEEELGKDGEHSDRMRERYTDLCTAWEAEERIDVERLVRLFLDVPWRCRCPS